MVPEGSTKLPCFTSAFQGSYYAGIYNVLSAAGTFWEQRSEELNLHHQSFENSYEEDEDESSGFESDGTPSETETEKHPLPSTPEKPVVLIGLLNKNLWVSFHEQCNEMNVSKTGRRMFPYINVDIKNLDDDRIYKVYLDFPLQSEHIWKYREGKWMESRLVEPAYLKSPPGLVEHPHSPNTGTFWMSSEDGISFRKIKFTNELTMTGSPDYVCLKTYHIYQPRINVVEVDLMTRQPVWDTLLAFSFPETVFIAVTSYRNQKISDLKICHNPYARAFKTEKFSGMDLENRKTFGPTKLDEQQDTPMMMYDTASAKDYNESSQSESCPVARRSDFPQDWDAHDGSPLFFDLNHMI